MHTLNTVITLKYIYTKLRAIKQRKYARDLGEKIVRAEGEKGTDNFGHKVSDNFGYKKSNTFGSKRVILLSK